MAKPLAVLIVEDSESDAQLLVHMLTKAGYTLTFEQVETAAQMRSALEIKPWDIVVSDFSMPEMDGHAALKILQETGSDIPFIVVSGTIGEETAVTMMKAGAHDYVMKGNLARLVPAVERELDQAEVRRERKLAEEALRKSEKEEKRKRAAELVLSHNQLTYEVKESIKRAAELTLAQQDLTFQKDSRTNTAELVLANKELTYQTDMKEKAVAYATHDHLTGLPNRVLLIDRISQYLLLAKRMKTLACLMTLDLDGFKSINDTHGHHIGDVVLKSIAKRLTELVRDTDTIARLGGDEFILLATETKSINDIKKLANRILKIVQKPIVVGDQKIMVGISIGIAYYPPNGQTAKTLMINSDKALYNAKAKGKNCYAFLE